MTRQTESSRTDHIQAKKPKVLSFSIIPALIRWTLVLIIIFVFNRLIFPCIIVPAFFTHISYISFVHFVYRFCHWLFWGGIVLSMFFSIRTSTKRLYIFSHSAVYIRGILFVRKKVIPGEEIIAAYLGSSFLQKRAGVGTLQLELNPKHRKFPFQNTKKKKNGKILTFADLKEQKCAIESIVKLMINASSSSSPLS